MTNVLSNYNKGLIVQKNWVNGKYFTLILLRDLTLCCIQITNYNISSVNLASIALNCFVNYAKECQCCMEIEECVDSLHSNIVICDARWSRAIMYNSTAYDWISEPSVQQPRNYEQVRSRNTRRSTEDGKIKFYLSTYWNYETLYRTRVYISEHTHVVR
jgi:hypothetical protein